jgi:hypothetical protein
VKQIRKSRPLDSRICFESRLYSGRGQYFAAPPFGLGRGHSKTMTRMLVCAVLARTQLSVALSLGFDLPCLTDVFIHGTNS